MRASNKLKILLIFLAFCLFAAGLFFALRSRPAIVAAESGSYRTKDTPFQASFAGQDTPSRVVFQKDGATLSFNLPDEDITWQKRGDKLIADVGDKAFSYSLLKNEDSKVQGLKEEIILKEPPLRHPDPEPEGVYPTWYRSNVVHGEESPAEVQNQFQFTLDLEGLTAKKGPDGLWHFFDTSTNSAQVGKELFFIPQPFMEDANGARSDNVAINIERYSSPTGHSEHSEESPTSSVGDPSSLSTPQDDSRVLTVTVDKEWLLSPERKYPIKIDPSLQLTVLTVHSHPQAGDNWTVDFETQGKADLKIIPDDEQTIKDLDFIDLVCTQIDADGKQISTDNRRESVNNQRESVSVQILERDVIYVEDFHCDGTATVTHLVNKARPHRLKFNFGGEIDYAYNAPGSATYTFSGVSQSTNDYYAYEDYGASVFSGPDDTGTSEATDTDYDNIESDNATRWESANASSDGDYDAQLYKFFISETESDVTQLDLKWNGYGETESGYSTYFYIWDYNSSAWEQLDSNDFTVTTDADLTGTISTNVGNYIDTDSEVVLMAKTKKAVLWSCGDTISYTNDDDSDTYNTVEIGDQCWLAENLNLDPDSADNASCSGTKYCYDDDTSNCDTYGGLYTWSTAMCGDSSSSSDPSGVQGLCPDGWHFPSDDELTDLEDNVCDSGTCSGAGCSGSEGSALAGNASLWSNGGLEADDDFGCSGFELLPGGRRSTNGSYNRLGSNAYVWSSTESDSSNAWFRCVNYSNTVVYRGGNDKDYGFSVRCLRD